MIEQQIEMTGMTVDTLRKAVAQLDTIDEQIAAVDAALKNLEVEGAAASFTLGNRYADLAAAESTIDATVNQLQSALRDVGLALIPLVLAVGHFDSEECRVSDGKASRHRGCKGFFASVTRR